MGSLLRIADPLNVQMYYPTCKCIYFTILLHCINYSCISLAADTVCIESEGLVATAMPV